MSDIKEYQLGSVKDLEFAKYLESRLKVFKDVEVTITYHEYFSKWYLSCTMPIEHNPDYILGLIDGIIDEHKRME